MERNIPHVLDVFSCSPRARRRVHATDIDKIAVQMKDADMGQKNPGSDSAVSVDSSDDENNISKYFDYLNEDDQGNGSASKRKKKRKTSGKDSQSKENIGKENIGKENKSKENMGKENIGKENKNKKQEVREQPSEHESRKTEYEKDMRHIERHLSMKKTIRKKMMRDLQQAFVENPDEFQQDPTRMAPEKKNNIDIRNLTFSKGRLSKSEHNFLDMLKDESVNEKDKKERKGFLGFNNNKNKDKGSKDNLKDDDSGHGSPSREPPVKAKSKPDIREVKDTPKEEKKVGFWKKLTGKGKNKR